MKRVGKRAGAYLLAAVMGISIVNIPQAVLYVFLLLVALSGITLMTVKKR